MGRDPAAGRGGGTTAVPHPIGELARSARRVLVRTAASEGDLDALLEQIGDDGRYRAALGEISVR